MLTKSIPYTFIRGGYFYFSRRVPADLRQHYSYHRVVQGLGTSSPQRARVQANIAAAKLDAYWGQMRLAKSEVIGMSLVREVSNGRLEVALKLPKADCPSLLDALGLFLSRRVKVALRPSVWLLSGLVTM